MNYGLNQFTGETCECGAKNPQYNYKVDAPSEDRPSDEDVKYKFDFEVEQPRVQDGDENEP